MKEIQTVYGNIYILSRDQIFQRIIQIIQQLCAKKNGPFTIGLPGGSTPKEFYRWVVAKNILKPYLLTQIIWMTSDERYVPLENHESNFGNADRLMLYPLGVTQNKKHPWKVVVSPQEAAEDYNNFFPPNTCFDLCILGMGDDCHIASIFPHSPLIHKNPVENFAAIDVPGKDTRLTITPNGLRRSSNILIIVTGKAKNQALKTVLEDSYDPKTKPAQLNKEWAKKVTWLVDNEAASKLSAQM